MTNIVIKPNSRTQNDKWTPQGMIIFPDGARQTERCEIYSKEFNTKREADLYFLQMSDKKYRIES